MVNLIVAYWSNWISLGNVINPLGFINWYLMIFTLFYIFNIIIILT